MYRINQYGPLNTHDLYKFAATILMFIDHIGLYFIDDYDDWYRVVGRTAAPIFFFIVGTAKHYDFKFRILAWGVLLCIVNYIAHDGPPINILINFVIIKAILDFFKEEIHTENLFLNFMLIGIIFLPLSTYIEYGPFGLWFAISGLLLTNDKYKMINWTSSALVSYFLIQLINFHWAIDSYFAFVLVILCAVLAFIFINFKPKRISLAPILSTPIKFVSRYSLEIYALHLSAFKLMKLV